MGSGEQEERSVAEMVWGLGNSTRISVHDWAKPKPFVSVNACPICLKGQKWLVFQLLITVGVLFNFLCGFLETKVCEKKRREFVYFFTFSRRKGRVCFVLFPFLLLPKRVLREEGVRMALFFYWVPF